MRQGEYSLPRLMPHKGDSSVNRKVSSAQFAEEAVPTRIWDEQAQRLLIGQAGLEKMFAGVNRVKDRESFCTCVPWPVGECVDVAKSDCT